MTKWHQWKSQSTKTRRQAKRLGLSDEWPTQGDRCNVFKKENKKRYFESWRLSLQPRIETVEECLTSFELDQVRELLQRRRREDHGAPRIALEKRVEQAE